MATSTRTKFTPNDPQVYNPLDRLSGTIRRYVVVEGLLTVAIFLATWFALALVLDFGVFKVFSWDWVQEGAWGLRVAALVLAVTFLIALIALRIGKRLTTDLTYPALALVLERRFPKMLGDRLITAVELANVKQAARYGYSAAMIHQTIAEARERVGRVNVSKAFNWVRLYVMGFLAAGILLATAVAAYASYFIAVRDVAPVRGTWKFFHVTSILVERDLLLRDTPWPRRALLELDPEIKETGIRVARDGASPRVKVRAYRWVIADRRVRDGWRPLVWSDVTPDLVEANVPELPVSSLRLPEDKGPLPAEASVWTLDAMWERARDNPAVRDRLSQALGGENYSALQHVFDRLEAIADDPAWERTVRRLDKPERVVFQYSGVLTEGGGPMSPEGSSEYAGEIGGLREDVEFLVNAEDYWTPPRAITLIPPPALISLKRIEYQPAYLYYPPPLVPDPARPKDEPTQAGPMSLKGKLQTMAEEKLSLTGDRSTFVVPAGTEVAITGTTELPIAKAYVRPKVGKVPGAKAGSAALVPLLLLDENTFLLEFRGDNRLTSAVELELVFENADRVQSSRPVLIQVTDDQAPVVEVVPQFIRRVGAYYYVTPRAKVPFNPESTITDDNGLGKVEYAVSWMPEESPLGKAMRVATVTRALIAPIGLPAPTLFQGTYHANATREAPTLERNEATFEVAAFHFLMDKVHPDTLAVMDQKLAEPRKAVKADLVRRVTLTSDIRPEVMRTAKGKIDTFKWRIDGDYFDLGGLKDEKGNKLEVTRGDIQPRYSMELKIRATDTNCDTGPKSTTNTPAIRLLVVSAADLLYEIGKDEEALGVKLADAIKKVEDAKKKYEYVRSKNAYAPIEEQLDNVRVRSKDAMQDLAKAKDIVQTLAREFRRIEKECIYNQLDDKVVAGYGAFANTADRIMGETPAPVSAAEEDELTRRTAPFSTFPNAENLTNAVQKALEEGRWADPVLVSDAEIALFGLGRELADLKKRIGEGETFDKVKNEIAVLRDEQKRVLRELQEWKFHDDGIRIKDIPDISAIGPVFLRKGEVKRIQHNINWRQYKEDSLVVKVTSSDPAAVVVPMELKLDFEKNDLKFDYEIRAANKEGDFTITLTPAAGPKIEYKVSVK